MGNWVAFANAPAILNSVSMVMETCVRMALS